MYDWGSPVTASRIIVAIPHRLQGDGLCILENLSQNLERRNRMFWSGKFDIVGCDRALNKGRKGIFLDHA